MTSIEQEPDRVPRGVLRLAALVIALGIAVSIGATVLLGRGELVAHRPVDSQPPARIDLRLFDVETEAEQLRRSADERLRSYGWVDRGHELVHVPLEVAAELYLQEQRR